MIVTILGSCANQTGNREAVSLILEPDSIASSILVDAGPGVVASLVRLSRKASQINCLILTHAHADHIAGVAYFLWHRHYECLGQPPASDITVYGLPDCIKLAKDTLEGCYGCNPFPFNIKWMESAPGDVVDSPDVQIEIVATDHTVPSIGLVFRSSGKVVVFSGDTLPCKSILTASLHADLLLHEGMWTDEYRLLADKTKHATSADAAKLAQEAGVKQLCLLHIFPKLIGSECRLLAEAGQHFQGPTCIPTDGTVLLV